MKKLFLWGTVASGLLAAYLMFKRGEKLGTIVQKTVAHPEGTLVDELKSAL